MNMPTHIFQLRPLEGWPEDVERTLAGKRKSRSTFPVLKAALRRTTARPRGKAKGLWPDLANEIKALKADGALIFLAIAPGDIAITGLLKRNTRLSDPSVVLVFEGKHGQTIMPCDTYDHWQANLRALSLTLTALRAVDRYGASKSGEQYQGWQRLPAQAALGPAPAAVVEARLEPSS